MTRLYISASLILILLALVPLREQNGVKAFTLDGLQKSLGEVTAILTLVEDEFKTAMKTLDPVITEIKTELNNSNNIMDGIKGIQQLLDDKSTLLGTQGLADDASKKISLLLDSLGLKYDDLQKALSDEMNLEIEKALQTLGIHGIPSVDIAKLEPLIKTVQEMAKNISLVTVIPDNIKQIAKHVEDSIKNGDLLNALKNGSLINSTLIKDIPELTAEAIGMLGNMEIGMLGLQDGVQKALAERVVAVQQTTPKNHAGSIVFGINLFLVSFVLHLNTYIV